MGGIVVLMKCCEGLLSDGDSGDRTVEADFRGVNHTISTLWKGHSHTHPEVSISQLLSLSPL